MIIFGWKIKPIAELKLNIPEIDSYCKKHNRRHRIIIGKKYNTLYFVPLNYFWAKERVFKTCDDCHSDYKESPAKIENLILDFYHKKISSNELSSKIKSQIEEYQKQAKLEEKKDNERFGDFIRITFYIIGFLILLLIIKVLFF